MAAWAGTLPVPMIRSYSASDGFKRIATQFESGPQRLVKVSSHYMKSCQTSMVMTQAQNATFQQLLVDSNDGTDWITGVKLDFGQGVQTVRARILSVAIKVIRQNEKYEVAISFETDDHR